MKTKVKMEMAVIPMLIFIIGSALSSCGVRGNPQPPLTQAELGHGEPGFKRASEEFAFPNVPSPTPVVAPGSREDVR
jgi:hypothetical protein